MGWAGSPKRLLSRLGTPSPPTRKPVGCARHTIFTDREPQMNADERREERIGLIPRRKDHQEERYRKQRNPQISPIGAD